MDNSFYCIRLKMFLECTFNTSKIIPNPLYKFIWGQIAFLAIDYDYSLLNFLNTMGPSFLKDACPGKEVLLQYKQLLPVH